MSNKQEVTYCYFGPHQGKGPGDGAVKRQLTHAILAQEIEKIEDAQDEYRYCQENMVVDR